MNVSSGIVGIVNVPFSNKGPFNVFMSFTCCHPEQNSKLKCQVSNPH